MTKLLHTGDNHLRAAQYSRFYRGQDFTDALTQIVDYGIEHKVDAILNSGDLLDTTRPTAGTIAALKGIHDKLHQAGIPMYVISGNHDLTDPHWITVVNPSNEPKGLVWVDNQRFTIKDVSVHALPFSSKETLLETLAQIDPVDVLMWHGSVAEFIGGSFGNKDVSITDFQLGKFKAVLLGDIHVHKQFTLTDGTIVAMPGSSEMCQQSENPCKYCDLYTFDNGKITSEALPLNTRQVILATLLEEADVDNLLCRLSEVNKKDPPMVFVKYNRELPFVQQRIYNVLDPREGIIRCSPLPRDKKKQKVDKVEAGLDPVDFLKDFLKEADGALMGLAENLLRPDCNASDILDTYIAQELR